MYTRWQKSGNAFSIKTELFIFAGITIIFAILYGQIDPLLMAGAPDEFGALTGGTLFTGQDWTSLTGTSYYGFGFTILLAPIFLIDNPLVRYFLMHCVNAGILGVIGVIGYRLMYHHLAVDNRLFCVLASIAAACYESNLRIGKFVYNELPLNFSVWIVLYLLVLLYETESLSKRKKLSALLAFALGYSLTIHTRALITVGSVCLFLLLYGFYKKSSLIDIPCFVLILTICVLAGLYSTKVVQEILFHALEKGTGANSIASSVSQGIAMLSQISSEKIVSFFASIFCRLWTLYVLSCGLFLFLTEILIKQFFKTIRARKNPEKSVFRFISSFLSVAIIISMTVFTWQKADSITTGFQKEIVNRQFFYIRYLVLYWVPGLLIVFAYFYKNTDKRILKRTLYACIIIVSICGHILQPLLSEKFSYNKVTGTEYFVPFTFSGYDGSIKTLYAANSIMLIFLLALICVCIYRKRQIFTVVISIVTSFYLFAFALYVDSIPKTKDYTEKTYPFYLIVKDLEKSMDLNQEIYCIDIDTKYRKVIQFDLADYHIVSLSIDMINEIEDGIIISAKDLETEGLDLLGESDIGKIYLYRDISGSNGRLD